MRAPTAANRSAAEGAAPDDWHWKVRRVLARFGARTVPALIEALSGEDDPAIRQFAAESLGHLGPTARSASDALRQAARQDENRAVRAVAASALRSLEGAGSA